ncbi:MAG: hypothetical protein RLY16_137, partial [Bacteroidota bacterium]
RCLKRGDCAFNNFPIIKNKQQNSKLRIIPVSIKLRGARVIKKVRIKTNYTALNFGAFVLQTKTGLSRG